MTDAAGHDDGPWNGDDEDDEAGPVGVHVPPGGSLLDGLKRKRAATQAAEDDPDGRSEWFDIPGFGGELQGKFRAQGFDTIKTLGKNVNKSKDKRKELLAMADLLTWSCLDMALVRANGERMRVGDVPIEQGGVIGDGSIVRFDELLCQATASPVPRGRGGQAPTQRDCLFSIIPNELAVIGLHNDVSEWMGDADAVANDEETFVGESPARQ